MLMFADVSTQPQRMVGTVVYRNRAETQTNLRRFNYVLTVKQFNLLDLQNLGTQVRFLPR